MRRRRYLTRRATTASATARAARARRERHERRAERAAAVGERVSERGATARARQWPSPGEARGEACAERIIPSVSAEQIYLLDICHIIPSSGMGKKLTKLVAAEGLFNSRLKLYPVNLEAGEMIEAQRLTFDREIYNPHHLERSDKPTKTYIDDSFERPVSDKSDTSSRSWRRAKQKAFDYMMSNNDMSLFVTLTFSADVVNRYSYYDIIDKLSTYLDNSVRRQGLKYLLVPEYHKDGAIHFHGIFNRAVETVDSGYIRVGKRNVAKETASSNERKNGKTIYNLPGFRLGYTTAISITGNDSRLKISKYIYKYMTKAGDRKIGGRYYLHSNNLNDPIYIYENIDFQHAPGDIVNVPETNMYFKVQNYTL